MNDLCEVLVQTAYAQGISRLVVGAAIFAPSSSKLLLLSRQPADFMGGIDELPSGKVEPGESLLEALHREIAEETGLQIELISFIDHFDYVSKSGRSTRQFNFLARANSDQVKICPEEHDGFKWIELSELPKTKATKKVAVAIEKAYTLI